MQQRLEQWDETRDNFKLTMARNMYGMGAPIRTMMERKAVAYVSRAAARERVGMIIC